MQRHRNTGTGDTHLQVLGCLNYHSFWTWTNCCGTLFLKMPLKPLEGCCCSSACRWLLTVWQNLQLALSDTGRAKLNDLWLRTDYGRGQKTKDFTQMTQGEVQERAFLVNVTPKDKRKAPKSRRRSQPFHFRLGSHKYAERADAKTGSSCFISRAARQKIESSTSFRPRQHFISERFLAEARAAL